MSVQRKWHQSFENVMVFFEVVHMLKSCSPLFNIFLFFFLSLCKLDSRLEGWISLPTKNTKRFGWDRKVMHSHCFAYLQIFSFSFST